MMHLLSRFLKIREFAGLHCCPRYQCLSRLERQNCLERVGDFAKIEAARWEQDTAPLPFRSLTAFSGVLPSDRPEEGSCSGWGGRGVHTATSLRLLCVHRRLVFTWSVADKEQRAHHNGEGRPSCSAGDKGAEKKASARNELPWSAITFRYCRSSKPGGSSVNKRETKTVLQVPLRALGCVVGDELLRVLCKEWRHLINKSGELVLHSDRYSSQLENKKDCIKRLDAILTELKQRPVAGKGKDPGEFKSEAAQHKYKARLLGTKRRDQYNRRCLQVHQRRL
ncbi:class i peptide chain release factor [Cystoisospora suis]|uniref:Class i peptide chain release factor n=1 Tax=Cystoisospora suis TaxID=483139 RepID=A0A2C6L537_9APIC|nr:class i peptide chain release factor [Cystoisospora suis]